MRWLASALVWMWIWIAAEPATGQVEIADLAGKPIYAVRIEGKELSEEEITRYIEVQPADRFDIRAVRKSIKMLYYLGLFGQVRVTARILPAKEPSAEASDGVELIFHLIPKRRVLDVDFIGNDVLDVSDLSRLVRFRRGEEFDRWKMVSAVQYMRGLYAMNGYRQARIVPRVDGPSDGDVRVGYYISEGEPTRIFGIRFQGNQVFRADHLINIMDLEPGDVLSQEKLEDGLERLREYYKKNDYLEVSLAASKPEVEAKHLWEDVFVEVEAGPKIIIRIEGNEVLKSRRLEKEIKSGWGGELTTYVLRDLVDRLEKIYHQQGYAKVKVRPMLDMNRMPYAKVLTFVIDEGLRVRVKEVLFEGNLAFSDRQLRAYIDNAMIDAISQSMLGQPVDRGDVDPLGGGHPLRGKPRRVNRPQGFLFELVPQITYLKEPYQKALEQIIDVYRSHGYVDAVVQTPILSFDGTGENLYITIPIQEGPKTLVESITLSGNQKLSALHLVEVADQHTGLVSPGGPLNLYGVEQLRKELVRSYRELGHVYCQIKQNVLFSSDRTLAEVQYEIEEGPSVKVGKVIVQGNLMTKRDVFDKALYLQSEDVFSPSKVSASKESLLALGVFSGVDIKMMDEDVVEERKNILVTVREHFPHSFTLIPGVSSGEGVRLELDYTHRNLFGQALELVGRTKVNYPVFTPLLNDQLRERYEQLDFLETLEGWVVAGLHWPRLWWLGRNVSARTDLVGLQDRAASYDLTKISFTPGLDTKLADELAMTLEVEIGYVRLDCPPNQDCGGAAAERWRRYDQGNLLLAALRPEISWDRRDNILRPRQGIFLSLQTEVANNLFRDKEVSYLRWEGFASGYLPLGREGVLALSLRGGSIFQLSRASNTPSHKKFWLGGRNSVRGFPEEGLIPADQTKSETDPSPCITAQGSNDEEICISTGGDAYVNVKAEIRFLLLHEVLEGAIFTDMGNLWIQPANVDFLRLRPTAGFGIRLITPIGPVAFDFGFNLDPDPRRREEDWSFHFNIGVF